MSTSVSVNQTENLRNKIHPKVFGLWISMASIMMMFAALTSAYIVRQAAGNWLEFQLPNQFFISTGVILLSSVTLHMAYRSFLNGKEVLYQSLLIISLVLGLLFVVLQYSGWLEMEQIGVYLKGNPSGSFVYVISGLHAAHVLGGVAAILVSVIFSFVLKYRVTKRRKTRLKLVLHYWHFVDFLWIYLLLFFILQQ
jgi:cytochrome c oxidase subunit 3